MIEFGGEVCGELGEALGREWLETNGLGGYASSTIVGLNTRRYHGLLVAATRPPVGRTVLLSKLEETLTIGGRRYELSSNQYPGVVHPEGFRLLRRFRLGPFPVFTFEVDGIEIEKTVLMPHGENTTAVKYTLRSGPAEKVELELRPLVICRDYHHLGPSHASADPRVALEDSLVSIHFGEGAPALHLAHDARASEPSGLWYRDFEYAEERARGFDFREDLFNPCALRFDLSETREARVVALTEPRDESRRRAAALLAPLREHLSTAGLGHVSEIFDADPPHRPRGCVAQAWSVAELLRAYVEDIVNRDR
ncbi:MAG TPA: glycogen debranching enzyme N-terminal domain-containing protein [Pyrinomonadaceae bacterium]|nr:glycogen debranching enzyme N-terminal domain-containing protein [Pyrinomonadaceae bacterium]